MPEQPDPDPVKKNQKIKLITQSELSDAEKLAKIEFEVSDVEV
jgi:hypothetical protein